MITYESVASNYVYFEPEDRNIRYGINYLNGLSSEEAQVFFGYAYSKGEAPFQDFNRYHFSLLYGGGKYTLISKS